MHEIRILDREVGLRQKYNISEERSLMRCIFLNFKTTNRNHLWIRQAWKSTLLGVPKYFWKHYWEAAELVLKEQSLISLTKLVLPDGLSSYKAFGKTKLRDPLSKLEPFYYFLKLYHIGCILERKNKYLKQENSNSKGNTALEIIVCP